MIYFVNSIGIRNWASLISSRYALPQVLRRLVFATVKDLKSLDFPAYESAQRSGFDGQAECVRGNAWVPEGKSAWETGVNKDVKGKADDDFTKRTSEIPAVVRMETTYVALTPRHWEYKETWADEQRKSGEWKDVRAYDADDLEQWTETAPSVGAWFGRLLGNRPEGVDDIDAKWEMLSASTVKKLVPAVFLGSRDKELSRLTSWTASDPSVLCIQTRSPTEGIDFFTAYVASLDETSRDAIASRYRAIIEHENYNPRLIEAMTSRLEYSVLEPEDYLGAFLFRLHDPSQLWEHAYEEQLSEASRHVLLAMIHAGTPVRLGVLERDFDTLFRMRSQTYGWVQRPEDFARSLNELDGTFVRIRNEGGSRLVEWYNPSVLDFMTSWLRRHPKDTEDLLRVTNRFDQIEALTNSAPVLVVGSVIPDTPPGEAIVADAIARTTTEWTWNRLYAAFRIADRFDCGAVRQLVIEGANTLFESNRIAGTDLSTVIDIMKRLRESYWLGFTHLRNWTACLKAAFLAMDEDTFDQLDDFMPLAKWVEQYQNDLSDEEISRFQILAQRVIKSELRSSYYPNYESIWLEMHEKVESLQEMLSINCESELLSIKGEIERADKPQSSPPISPSLGNHTGRASIDSIFDALIE